MHMEAYKKTVAPLTSNIYLLKADTVNVPPVIRPNLVSCKDEAFHEGIIGV